MAAYCRYLVADAIEKQAEAFLAAWFATRQVVQALNFNRFAREGLSAGQFILLTMLGERGAASAAEVARSLNVDVTTTMRTAESLAARGLIARERDVADRRRHVLSLTPEGREVHARMQAAFVAQVSRAFRRMPPALRAGLIDGLSALVSEMGSGAHGPSGGPGGKAPGRRRRLSA